MTYKYILSVVLEREIKGGLFSGGQRAFTAREQKRDASLHSPEILSKVVYGKKAHPPLITVKQLVLVVPLRR
jgi:hypothetical protein